MYGRTCTQLQTLTPMTYSCQKKIKVKGEEESGRAKEVCSKKNWIKEAIKLVLESLHQKLRIVNTRTTKSGIISRIILLLENKKSVKEEWIISNKWTFKSERERSDKKIDCKDNDNTETKIERSNEVQGDKPKRIENSVC